MKSANDEVNCQKDLRLEKELRRMKRIPLDGEIARMKRIELSRKRAEPDLNRVKRVRRHMKPIATYAMSANNHFDPGLVRVKRQKRSPSPIKTKNGHGLSRMKRLNKQEREIQRMKRNMHKHKQFSKRAHDLRNTLKRARQQRQWRGQRKRDRLHPHLKEKFAHGRHREMMKKNVHHRMKNHGAGHQHKPVKRHWIWLIGLVIEGRKTFSQMFFYNEWFTSALFFNFFYKLCQLYLWYCLTCFFNM